MKVLLVIDMQKDFVEGALGTKEAREIVPFVLERIQEAKREGERVVFTQDTHGENYLDTQEGRFLPVPHCVKGSDGWQIIRELRDEAENCLVMEKPSFGSQELLGFLKDLDEKEGVEQVTFIGLCTDICVISNAMIAKAALPEALVQVEEGCCAGVSPKSHQRALEAMKVCQIVIKEK